MKKFEFSAKTVEQAIEVGLSELNLTREQCDIEILSKGGLLSKAKVAISKKLTEGELVLEFIEQLLEKMGKTCAVEMTEDDDSVNINIIGTDTGSIIGYRGEVLDSMQYLSSLYANSRSNAEKYKRITIDSEKYREKREQTLIALAKRIETKTAKSFRKFTLEPMNPYERRIIHSALQDSTLVTTTSEGKEPYRRVVVIPKNYKPRTSYNKNRR